MRKIDEFATAADTVYDVAIIGGGINGACLYARLCQSGYKVILLDKGDFATGTSQSSGMMIWGGLLYLKNFDLSAVYGLSQSRDRMIRQLEAWVTPQVFRFLPASKGYFRKTSALVAFYLYWLFSHFRRQRPKIEARYKEQKMLHHPWEALLVEEGVLRHSDSRFVLSLVMRHSMDHAVALNYAEVRNGTYSRRDGLWHLEVIDALANGNWEIRAHTVVNCAGVWTDRINSVFGIQSPWKHVFSKGVYLVFEKGLEDQEALVLKMIDHDDVISSIPWGPVELWGPTETSVSNIDEGFHVTPNDIAFLLDQRQHFMKSGGCKEEIIALRCGVRPLAVPISYEDNKYPLTLSRSARVAFDRERRWVSVYGGKFTGHAEVASQVEKLLSKLLPDVRPVAQSSAPDDHEPEMTEFPGLTDAVPTAAWCRNHEHCQTLDDYLRRRTNIAQWVPRCGLGRNDENSEHIRAISLELANGDALHADLAFQNYQANVVDVYDNVLARV